MKIPAFRDWILRKLGYPITKVNIDDKQMYDRIMEAVDKFMKHHVDGSYRDFYILNLTQGVDTYSLPANIYSVLNIVKASESYPNLEMMQVVFSDVYRNGRMFRVDPVDWVVLQSKLSLIRTTFEKTIDFVFNPVQHKIRIIDKIERSYSVALEVYSFDDIDDEATGDDNLQNILDQEWVRNYALALCKEQWGTNLMKMKGISFLGVTVDPEKMISDAVGDKNKLEDDLIERFGDVDPIFFG